MPLISSNGLRIKLLFRHEVEHGVGWEWLDEHGYDFEGGFFIGDEFTLEYPELSSSSSKMMVSMESFRLLFEEDEGS